MNPLNPVIEWAAAILIVIGAFFLLVGAIGMVRLPDFYMRLHAPTKASTLGVGGWGGGVSASKMAWTTCGIWRVMSRVNPAWMAQNTSKCSRTTTPKPQGLRLERVCR